ncbi:LysM peptidoglycan-binding domain-containing protein [Alphaproteobacteria bacterium]|nr:LysM peptidoglycan-binding domain-containing protein [Alphaproteobacteria bacterium]
MKFTKVIYFLLAGGILASIALIIVLYQPKTTYQEDVVVPLVKEEDDANPIETKLYEKQDSEVIKLEVIRVRPDGSLVIAGKGLPNSKIEIISGSTVIATTQSDNIGEFVAVPDKQLKSGEYLLAFRQTTKANKISIANEAVAINVTGGLNDIPIVAIIDSEGKLGARVIQAPGLIEKETKSKVDKVNDISIKILPTISILAITYDIKVGQLILSGIASGGAQVNAGFSGKETSSTKILNNSWSLTIPGKLISGKQKVFAFIIGKDGKVLSKNSINITGSIIKDANGKTFVVVQKGDALWNIAYNRLGLGIRYTDIVELNKEKIKNPNLIYPKQLFILP